MFRYLKIISVNLAVLLVGIAMLELVFGGWFSANNLNKLNILRDRTIHYELNGLYPSPEKVITYSRDKWGFRGDYPGVNKIDILTIGGSTTEQRYIADGQTFQDVLQGRFQADGKHVYVVNAGIDGQSTFGHIRDFDWWFPYIPDLKVRFFLFFVGVNDFKRHNSDTFDDLRGRKLSPMQKLENMIKTRSVLYHVYRTLEGMVLARMMGLTHGAGHDSQAFSRENWTTEPIIGNEDDYRQIMKKDLAGYEKRLRILCRKVESAGSRAIFVTQSKRRMYDFQGDQLIGTPLKRSYNGRLYNGVDYYYMSRLLNQVTGRVANECGIFVDLDDELKFDISRDFYDYVHFTPSGAKKIGDYLYTKLKGYF